MTNYFVVTDCGVPVAILSCEKEAEIFKSKRGHPWWRIVLVPYKSCKPL